MKLTQLRDLVTVAQRGGLRRAARHLGLAQPAITRSIRDLENELGATLFERNTTGMELTPIGQAFFRRCVAIQHELKRACDEVQQMQGVASGSISVGLSTVPHVAMLPHVMAPFLKRYPDVALEITEGTFPEVEDQIRKGAMDFYIGPVWDGSLTSEFLSEKLFDNKRIVMGRPGNPFSHAKSLAELVGANWVTTAVAATPEIELYPLFESHGLPKPKIAVRAHSSMSMIMAASSSDLLTLVPQQWRGFGRETGRLVHIEIDEEISAPPICMVIRSSLPLAPAAEHLADLFRRAALNRIDAPYEKPFRPPSN